MLNLFMDCFIFPGLAKVLQKFGKVPGTLRKECDLQNFASQTALANLRALPTVLNPNMTLLFFSRFNNSLKKFAEVWKNLKQFFSEFRVIWHFQSLRIIIQKIILWTILTLNHIWLLTLRYNFALLRENGCLRLAESFVVEYISSSVAVYDIRSCPCLSGLVCKTWLTLPDMSSLVCCTMCLFCLA